MRKAFVVGHPIQHSRSPLIHGYWLRQHGISGSYERVDVAPADLDEFLVSFPAMGFVGGNVTIPHKEATFDFVEHRTDRANRVRAINTLWYDEEGTELWGDNTDVLGFMANLDQSLGSGWETDVETALVLGAGGAARAVVAGLHSRVPRIAVSNRTASKAAELVEDFEEGGTTIVQVVPSDLADAAVAEAQLIVNTTSLGMAGHPPLGLDLSAASNKTIVADIVYVPLKTPLLAAAEARGLRAVDGLGMLLHQAAPGFARWFGVTPEVTPELRALVAADVEGRR